MPHSGPQMPNGVCLARKSQNAAGHNRLMPSSSVSTRPRPKPDSRVHRYWSKISSDYDPERRTQSSIQWTGDIIAADKPPAKIRSQDLKPKKISRALLSDHMEALYVALALLPLQAARQAIGALQVIQDVALGDLGLLDGQELHRRSPRGRRRLRATGGGLLPPRPGGLWQRHREPRHDPDRR
jgi:hypothetical protein